MIGRYSVQLHLPKDFSIMGDLKAPNSLSREKNLESEAVTAVLMVQEVARVFPLLGNFCGYHNRTLKSVPTLPSSSRINKHIRKSPSPTFSNNPNPPLRHRSTNLTPEQPSIVRFKPRDPRSHVRFLSGSAIGTSCLAAQAGTSGTSCALSCLLTSAAQSRAFLNKGDRILCLKTETATCPDLDFALRARPKTSRQHDTIPAPDSRDDIDTSTTKDIPYHTLTDPARWITRKKSLSLLFWVDLFRYVLALSFFLSFFLSYFLPLFCFLQHAQHSTAQHSTSHSTVLQHTTRLLGTCHHHHPWTQPPFGGQVNSNSRTWRSHAKCKTPSLPLFPDFP
jgi:hypothetical protein